MAEFTSPQEEAAYWQGRYEEAADALQHERARIDRLLIATAKWVEPTEKSLREDG